MIRKNKGMRPNRNHLKEIWPVLRVKTMTFISLFVSAQLTASVLNWCFWSWEGKINSGCGEQPWFLICSLFAATSIFKSITVQHHSAISLTESQFVMCNGMWQRSKCGYKTLDFSSQYVNLHLLWHWKGLELILLWLENAVIKFSVTQACLLPINLSPGCPFLSILNLFPSMCLCLSCFTPLLR